MTSRYKILVIKPERKRPLGERCKWEDNIRVDLKEIRCQFVNWIHTLQDRDHWRAFVDSGSIKGGERLDCHLLKNGYGPCS